MKLVMAIRRSVIVDLLVLTLITFTISPLPIRATHLSSASSSSDEFNRYSFPLGFLFGTASASYQYEGAVAEGGRSPSIWDNFTHTYPERNNMQNGDIAVDFYHRYKEDIQLMKKMNMNAFRFSISWSRILPSGKLKGGVNREGIQFYRNLITELIANGLEPFVTIFHWDLPQALEEEYGGFLSPRIVDDFRDYARLCFDAFGSKVKNWVTLNEPGTFSGDGYMTGGYAPGRCSKWISKACEEGDSSTEPYIVAHHQLLSHAAAVQLYRKYYQKRQNGKIGIVLNSPWAVPFTDSEADKEAAKRILDFRLGWFLNPITYGEYPKTMRHYVKDRLPKFTNEQSEILEKSYDFVGINYYSGRYAADKACADPQYASYLNDSCVALIDERHGIPLGEPSPSPWLHIFPPGIRYLVNHIKDTYQNPTIYITENGVDELYNGSAFVPNDLKDPQRTHSCLKHLENLAKAIREDGVDVKGYFAWSFLDNFEWSNGYTLRFGFYYIDYTDDLKRYPKDSAIWFTKFLKKKRYHPNHGLNCSNSKLCLS